MTGKRTSFVGRGTAPTTRAATSETAVTDTVVTDSGVTSDPFSAPKPVAKSTPREAAKAAQEVEVRPGFKLTKAREVKPHVSLYLHPRVIAKVREIAAVDNERPHKIYLDALALYLQTKHGVSLDDLSAD